MANRSKVKDVLEIVCPSPEWTEDALEVLRFGTTMNIQQLIEAAVQEIDLEIEAPAWHIFIEIHQIRIVVYILKLRDPAVMLAEQFREGCFTGTDITCNRDMLWFLALCHFFVE